MSESGWRPIAVAGRFEPVRRARFGAVADHQQADARRQALEVALELVLGLGGLDGRERERRGRCRRRPRAARRTTSRTAHRPGSHDRTGRRPRAQATDGPTSPHNATLDLQSRPRLDDLRATRSSASALDERSVRRRVEQPRRASARVEQVDAQDPALAVRVLVHEFGRVVERVVDRARPCPRPARRCRTPTSSTRSRSRSRPAIDLGADIGQLHEHDVAEAVLREVGDADRRRVSPVDAHPLVLASL